MEQLETDRKHTVTYGNSKFKAWRPLYLLIDAWIKQAGVRRFNHRPVLQSE